MSHHFVVGAIGVAVVIVSSASAPANAQASSGHFEWRSTAQSGPRVQLTAPRRVFIASPNDPSATRQLQSVPRDPATPCPPPHKS